MENLESVVYSMIIMFEFGIGIHVVLQEFWDGKSK